MKILVGNMGSGKTTELLKMAHNNGGYIVCRSRSECSRISYEAKKRGYNIHLPISYDEFLHRKYCGTNITEFYIDGVEDFLTSLTSVKIEAITLRTHSDKKQLINLNSFWQKLVRKFSKH